MLEKTAEVFELGHRDDELFEVLEPPGGVGRPVRLPHRGITRFVEDDLHQVCMLDAFRLRSPAVERGDEACERIARGGPELVAGAQYPCRFNWRETRARSAHATAAR